MNPRIAAGVAVAGALTLSMSVIGLADEASLGGPGGQFARDAIASIDGNSCAAAVLATVTELSAPGKDPEALQALKEEFTDEVRDAAADAQNRILSLLADYQASMDESEADEMIPEAQFQAQVSAVVGAACDPASGAVPSLEGAAEAALAALPAAEGAAPDNRDDE